MKKESQEEREEQLRDENAFLKMKLMLEHGAQFIDKGKTDIPPELENFFLQNVAAFEEQFSKQETTTVFEAVGKPIHFKPVEEIPEEDFADAWGELKAHLNKYGIDLSFRTYNVDERELYRFTVEELFKEEIILLNLPGWNYNFTYDEFHPDLEYEAIHAANEAMRAIFRTSPLEHRHQFFENNLKLNSYQSLTRETFLRILNRFKESFDEIIYTSNTGVKGQIEENSARVTGKFRIKCVSGDLRIPFKGVWKVDLVLEDKFWRVTGIEITGLDLI